jgi:hypothetical protein
MDEKIKAIVFLWIFYLNIQKIQLKALTDDRAFGIFLYKATRNRKRQVSGMRKNNQMNTNNLLLL